MFPIPSRSTPQLRSRALLAGGCVSAAILAGGSLAAQARTPVPAKAPAVEKRATEPALPAIAPETSYLWIRVRGMQELATKLASHPIGLAVSDLLASGRDLSRSVLDLEQQVAAFASTHGISTEVLSRAFGNETQLAIFPSGDSHQVLLVVRLGEHAPSFADLLEGLPPQPNDPTVRPIRHPFATNRSLYATLEDAALIVATSPAAVHTGKELLAGGKGLATSSDLRSLWIGADESRNPWFACFLRPMSAWRTSRLSQETPLARFLMDSGLSQVSAILVRSTFEDDGMHDECNVLLGKEGSFPFEFIGQRPPEASLARLVPPQCTNWVAANVAPQGLLSFLRRSRVALPGIGRLEVLEADLKPAANLAGLDDLASLFGGDLLLLGGSGDSGPHALALAVSDAFRLRTLLGQIGTKVELPGGNQDIHQFRIERGGSSIQLAACDDVLLIAADDASMAALLEQYLSGSDELRVRQTFDTVRKETWCVGREDPRARLLALDPNNERGLRPLANHLDLSTFQALRTGQIVRIESAGTTGASHLVLLALDGLVSAMENTGPTAELAVLASMEKLWLAQDAFVSRGLRDRDEDQIGEAGTLRDLVMHKLFEPTTDLTVESAEVVSGHGYRITIQVPGDIQRAEQAHAIVAWPSQPGVTGKTSFVMLRDGTVHEHPWVPSLDPQAGPTAAQIFEGATPGGGFVAGWSPRPRSPADAESARAKQQAVLAAVAEDIVQAHVRLDAARKKNDVAAVRRHVEHPDLTVQARAAHYLGDLKDRESVPVLARILKESPSVDVRRRAARALSLIRDPRGASTLCESLADRDGKVRLFAATGLLGSNVPGARKALLDMIDSYTDDAEGDRSQAVLALNDTADPTVLEALVATPEGAARFQEALVYCFQQLSPKLDAERETQVLIKALGSKNRALRAYAIQRLGAAKHTEALPTLVSRLATEEPALQPALHLTIEALTPPEQREASGDAMSRLSELGKSALGGFRSLPGWARYAIALSPLFLLAVLMLLRRRSVLSGSPRARLSNIAAPPEDATIEEEQPVR